MQIRSAKVCRRPHICTNNKLGASICIKFPVRRALSGSTSSRDVVNFRPVFDAFVVTFKFSVKQLVNAGVSSFDGERRLF